MADENAVLGGPVLDVLGGPAGLAALKRTIVAAGDAALEIQRQSQFHTEYKHDQSPVTQADRTVEQLIGEFIADAVPDAEIVGEEHGTQAAKGHGRVRFIIDPIDGTRAFIRGLPTWSVLVALEAVQPDPEHPLPALGIAYMPARGELYVGVRGGGATLNGAPLRVSHTAKLTQALITHGSLGQFLDAGEGDVLLALGRGTFTQRGFSDFDGYRTLLLGQADAMVEPGVKAWDLGPAAVLVEEAGGHFTDWSGKSTIESGTSLASNGALHTALLELIGKHMLRK